jgi:hypothetical protein
LGAISKSVNQAANNIIIERQAATRMLKEQLIRAHNRMKKYANSKRSERKFHIGNWVYLKLHMYRQISVQGNTSTHKLKQKYYAPFEILEKIGVVAYKLNLPTGSLIHHVFHVSQLKKGKGSMRNSVLKLPVLSPSGRGMN